MLTLRSLCSGGIHMCRRWLFAARSTMGARAWMLPAPLRYLNRSRHLVDAVAASDAASLLLARRVEQQPSRKPPDVHDGALSANVWRA